MATSFTPRSRGSRPMFSMSEEKQIVEFVAIHFKKGKKFSGYQLLDFLERYLLKFPRAKKASKTVKPSNIWFNSFQDRHPEAQQFFGKGLGKRETNGLNEEQLTQLGDDLINFVSRALTPEELARNTKELEEKIAKQAKQAAAKREPRRKVKPSKPSFSPSYTPKYRNKPSTSASSTTALLPPADHVANSIELPSTPSTSTAPIPTTPVSETSFSSSLGSLAITPDANSNSSRTDEGGVSFGNDSLNAGPLRLLTPKTEQVSPSTASSSLVALGSIANKGRKKATAVRRKANLSATPTMTAKKRKVPAASSSSQDAITPEASSSSQAAITPATSSSSQVALIPAAGSTTKKQLQKTKAKKRKPESNEVQLVTDSDADTQQAQQRHSIKLVIKGAKSDSPSVHPRPPSPPVPTTAELNASNATPASDLPSTSTATTPGDVQASAKSNSRAKKTKIDPNAKPLREIVFEVGSPMEARDYGEWWSAKIAEVYPFSIQVHFIGWGIKYDRVYEKTSESIRGPTTVESTPQAQELKIGDVVAVRLKEYKVPIPGNVSKIHSNGSCNIYFINHVTKTINPKNVRKIEDEDEQVAIREAAEKEIYEKLSVAAPGPNLTGTSTADNYLPAYKTGRSDRKKRLERRTLGEGDEGQSSSSLSSGNDAARSHTHRKLIMSSPKADEGSNTTEKSRGQSTTSESNITCDKPSTSSQPPSSMEEASQSNLVVTTEPVPESSPAVNHEQLSPLAGLAAGKSSEPRRKRRNITNLIQPETSPVASTSSDVKRTKQFLKKPKTKKETRESSDTLGLAGAPWMISSELRENEQDEEQTEKNIEKYRSELQTAEPGPLAELRQQLTKTVHSRPTIAKAATSLFLQKYTLTQACLKHNVIPDVLLMALSTMNIEMYPTHLDEPIVHIMIKYIRDIFSRGWIVTNDAVRRRLRSACNFYKKYYYFGHNNLLNLAPDDWIEKFRTRHELNKEGDDPFADLQQLSSASPSVRLDGWLKKLNHMVVYHNVARDHLYYLDEIRVSLNRKTTFSYNDQTFVLPENSEIIALTCVCVDDTVCGSMFIFPSSATDYRINSEDQSKFAVTSNGNIQYQHLLTFVRENIKQRTKENFMVIVDSTLKELDYRAHQSASDDNYSFFNMMPYLQDKFCNKQQFFIGRKGLTWKNAIINSVLRKRDPIDIKQLMNSYNKEVKKKSNPGLIQNNFAQAGIYYPAGGKKQSHQEHWFTRIILEQEKQRPLRLNMELANAGSCTTSNTSATPSSSASQFTTKSTRRSRRLNSALTSAATANSPGGGGSADGASNIIVTPSTSSSRLASPTIARGVLLPPPSRPGAAAPSISTVDHTAAASPKSQTPPLSEPASPSTSIAAIEAGEDFDIPPSIETPSRKKKNNNTAAAQILPISTSQQPEETDRVTLLPSKPPTASTEEQNVVVETTSTAQEGSIEESKQDSGPKFSDDRRVTCRWTNGFFYPACVLQVNPDGTYFILYDDNHKRNNVDPSWVNRRNKAIESPMHIRKKHFKKYQRTLQQYGIPMPEDNRPSASTSTTPATQKKKKKEHWVYAPVLPKFTVWATDDELSSSTATGGYSSVTDSTADDKLELRSNKRRRMTTNKLVASSIDATKSKNTSQMIKTTDQPTTSETADEQAKRRKSGRLSLAQKIANQRMEEAKANSSKADAIERAKEISTAASNDLAKLRAGLGIQIATKEKDEPLSKKRTKKRRSSTFESLATPPSTSYSATSPTCESSHQDFNVIDATLEDNPDSMIIFGMPRVEHDMDNVQCVDVNADFDEDHIITSIEDPSTDMGRKEHQQETADLPVDNVNFYPSTAIPLSPSVIAAHSIPIQPAAVTLPAVLPQTTSLLSPDLPVDNVNFYIGASPQPAATSTPAVKNDASNLKRTRSGRLVRKKLKLEAAKSLKSPLKSPARSDHGAANNQSESVSDVVYNAVFTPTGLVVTPRSTEAKKSTSRPAVAVATTPITSPDKPSSGYKCQHCPDKKFRKEEHLKKHMKNHHNSKPEVVQTNKKTSKKSQQPSVPSSTTAHSTAAPAVVNKDVLKNQLPPEDVTSPRQQATSNDVEDDDMDVEKSAVETADDEYQPSGDEQSASQNEETTATQSTTSKAKRSRGRPKTSENKKEESNVGLRRSGRSKEGDKPATTLLEETSQEKRPQEELGGNDEEEVTNSSKTSNERKSSESESSLTNCKCNDENKGGLMLQCDLCFTWKHGACEGLTDKEVNAINDDDKFICSFCKNSRNLRPQHQYAWNNDLLTDGIIPSLAITSEPKPTADGDANFRENAKKAILLTTMVINECDTAISQNHSMLSFVEQLEFDKDWNRVYLLAQYWNRIHAVTTPCFPQARLQQISNKTGVPVSDMDYEAFKLAGTKLDTEKAEEYFRNPWQQFDIQQFIKSDGPTSEATEDPNKEKLRRKVVNHAFYMTARHVLLCICRDNQERLMQRRTTIKKVVQAYKNLRQNMEEHRKFAVDVTQLRIQLNRTMEEVLKINETYKSLNKRPSA